MRTLMVGGFGLALARALMREIAVPVDEGVAVRSCEFDFEDDYEPGCDSSRSSAKLSRPVTAHLQPYRTGKDSVWTAEVATRPMKTLLNLQGVLPTEPITKFGT